MRGNDRNVGQLVQQLLQLLRAGAHVNQFIQRGVERTAPHVLFVAMTHDAAALLQLRGFLGDVDQAEIGAECAHHLGQGFWVERIDQRHQALAFFRVILLVQLDEAGSQLLDSIVYLRAGVFQQNVAQQVAEQFDPRAQLLVDAFAAEQTGAGFGGQGVGSIG